MKISYLGPAGSHHSYVAASIAGELDAETLPVEGYELLLRSLDAGTVDYAILAVETNLCGMIEPHFRAVLDSSMTVCGEYAYAAPMVLAVAGGGLDDITHVHSHPQAISECRQWLRSNLPSVEIGFSGSTAAGARDASAAGWGHAAICGPSTAESYGLMIVVDDVCDEPGDQTLFWLLGKSNITPREPSRCTVLVAPHDASANRVLRAVSVNDVPLLRVDSVSRRRHLGDYLIRVDVRTEGPAIPSDLIEALTACGDVRVLGHYPTLTPALVD